MTLTLEMGGSPRTFHFGNGFIGNSLETLGVGLADLFNKMGENPYKIVPMLMYESYKFNLWMQKKPMDDVTVEDFIRWCSEVPDVEDGPMSMWVTAFTDSRTKHLPKESKNAQKGKKKPVRK